MLKDRIKEERAKKGISQLKLATIIGVSQQTIGSWETGRTEPDQASLKKLSQYFNVSSDSLLENNTINATNYDLSPKEKKDIAKDLENVKKELMESEELMFDGQPMSTECIESILSALEIGMEMVRKKNKAKYTPKKYRK